MPTMNDLARVEVDSVAALRRWFETNHAQTESIWLVTYKKRVPEKYVSVQEVLDEALCFGWMDGRRKKLDEERTMQLLSPRKAQHWARSYKLRAEKLIASLPSIKSCVADHEMFRMMRPSSTCCSGTATPSTLASITMSGVWLLSDIHSCIARSRYGRVGVSC